MGGVTVNRIRYGFGNQPIDPARYPPFRSPHPKFPLEDIVTHPVEQFPISKPTGPVLIPPMFRTLWPFRRFYA
jgi:hypothetical protein